MTGSLVHDNVVQGAMDGVRVLLRHAESVVIAHHDNKGGDIFGSVFLTGMMASKIAITRPDLRDGRPGRNVAVTVERLKFDTPGERLAYTLDGPFLELVGESASEDIKRPDVLVLLPTEWTPLAVARKLVNHLLGDNDGTREKTWQRLRKDWQAAGVIEQRGGNIRRVS